MESKSPVYLQFDHAELEREYSPSSCVDDIMVYINQYIQVSKQNISSARETDSVRENLRYGESADEALDLFLPRTTPTRKLQVYIHGGYWQELSKNESAFAAEHFQQAGHHMAVLDYTLAPSANLTEIVEQNRRAIAWLYNHADELGFDANEIYLSGSSAGGHLVLMLLATNWQNYGLELTPGQNIIQGVCAVSPVVDLTPIQLTYVNEPLQLTEDEIQHLSPIKLDFANLCPIILAYGENETGEFKRHSEIMADRLMDLGFSVQLAEVTNKNHFDVVMDLGKANTWLSQQVLAQMAAD